MLVLVRLSPKGGLTNLCTAIESEKRNLYWEDVQPLYAITQEGKKYVSILLDVKNLDAVMKVFVKNVNTMATVKDTRTIPIMSPIYFPVPEDHATDLVSYLVYLRVSPEHYQSSYQRILETKPAKGIHTRYLSYSFGDDDIILNVMAKDREAATGFVEKRIMKIPGVVSYDISRVIRTIPLLPPAKLQAHKDRFLWTKPAGEGGKIANRAEHEAYMKEKATMTVFVRLFAKKDVQALWEDIEARIPGFETEDLVPLYASQQEDKDYITVIFETSNFEGLKDVLVENVATMQNVRKTRTVPLVEPTYFLLPKGHPDELYRFLFSIRGEPGRYQSIRANIVGSELPGNFYLTYLCYSLGKDDLLVSALAESRKAAQNFGRSVLDTMAGIESYDVSNQLRTLRLTSKERWKRHQDRFLSSHDRLHRRELDPRYDWTDDFRDFAALTGAFIDELEN
ncbi:MAG: Lrp/AsnC ligand binding domain-containing protein [Thermoplasmata archaeon]|nr:Lrp/AsnC ligand binding domain-containing protein [Thermoplasmata archaeon]